jgi:hypothetical protein
MKMAQKSLKCTQEGKFFKKIDFQRAFCCVFSSHKKVKNEGMESEGQKPEEPQIYSKHWLIFVKSASFA